MEAKTLKFMPYCGENSEIFKGTKTKVGLLEDRFYYAIKFTQSVVIEIIRGEEDYQNEKKEVSAECDEAGFVMKADISGISKYIDTKFNEVGDAYSIHKVDVAYGGTILTLSFAEVEDKNTVYEALDNWKNNK